MMILVSSSANIYTPADMDDDCKETIHPVTVFSTLACAAEIGRLEKERERNAVRQFDVAVLLFLVFESLEVESEDVRELLDTHPEYSTRCKRMV